MKGHLLMADHVDGPPGPPGLDEIPEAAAPAALPDETPPPSLLPDLIPSILPSSQIHLFSGASGVGKTALTAALVAAFRSGSALFSSPLLQCRKVAFIGVITSDRPWHDHALWYRAAGVEGLPHYSLVDDMSFSPASLRAKGSDRFKLFKSCVESLEKASRWSSLPPDSLIILDPISLFIGSFLDYDKVFSYMLNINQFCRAREITVLAIAHAGKQKGDSSERYSRPQDRIAGTTAQTGCAGTTLHLSPPTEVGEDRYELTYVPHHAEAGTIPLDRDPSTGLFYPLAPVLYSSKQDAQAATRRLAEFLEVAFPADAPSDALGDPPAPPEATMETILDRAREAGIQRTAAYDYLRRLAKEKRVVKVRHGVWRRVLKSNLN